MFNVGFIGAIDVNTVADTFVRAYSSSSKITVSGNYRLRDNYADLNKNQIMISTKGKVPRRNKKIYIFGK